MAVLLASAKTLVSEHAFHFPKSWNGRPNRVQIWRARAPSAFTLSRYQFALHRSLGTSIFRDHPFARPPARNQWHAGRTPRWEKGIPFDQPSTLLL